MKEITKEELKNKSATQIESLKSEYEKSLKISKVIHVAETVFDYLFLGLAFVCMLAQNYSLMATCFLMSMGCKTLEFAYKKEAEKKRKSINICEEELKIREDLKVVTLKENLNEKHQITVIKTTENKIENANATIEEPNEWHL